MSDFKPSLSFLAKVRDGEVQRFIGSRNVVKVYGGAATLKIHIAQGYVKLGQAMGPSSRAFAELTVLGIEALDRANLPGK